MMGVGVDATGLAVEIRSGVENRIRRHMMRTRKLRGFGEERWSKRWLYQTLARLPGPELFSTARSVSICGPGQWVILANVGDLTVPCYG